ncbi:hypothetical protein QWY86_02945 [Pedobacter aquatilis]|uniref:hypothetical protein n=1 Tax=Pedobacter aquatilis TaxID=351343 RepID=UPI0025B51781|nr:hypothetical protein [Pedobacter aquatilis]MDN3585608.1 hypothetical protein [Pedobacter aquatilis]
MFRIPPNGTRIIHLEDHTINITRLDFNTFQFRIYNGGDYTCRILFSNNVWSLPQGITIPEKVREFLVTNLKVPIIS